MTQYVICALQMEGFHCWPEADGELAYLKNSHRHIFFITAEFPVRNANREIEIISQQNAIKRYLLSKYGDEDGACHFGRRSCEDIAAEILFLSTPSARRATAADPLCGLPLLYFYPRPLRGGRHTMAGRKPGLFRFLSTPSARRATYAA